MSDLSLPLDRSTITPACAPPAPTRPRRPPRRLRFAGVVCNNTGWVVLMAWAIATAGCHKNTPVSSTTPAGEQAQPEVTPSGSQQDLVGVAPGTSQPLDGVVDPFMTSQLRIFVDQQGRLPTNFAELARTRLDVVPRTPAGTTWAIDRVTQEVKMVKK